MGSDESAGRGVEGGRDLTWAGLLAHWTALARSSLALPRDAEGDRWRAAVPAIIGLQAITHALGEIDLLAPEEDRAVALDRAAVGIQTHAQSLHALWRGEQLHPELHALIDDARTALAAAKDGGIEWRVMAERLVVGHPGELVEALLASGFDGDLYVPVPGTVLFRSSPAAFARAGGGGRAVQAEHRAMIREHLGGKDVDAGEHVPGMRQVYRQFDFGAGRVVRDLVQPMDAELVAGQAQLVPAILDGREQPVTLPIPGMANQEPVPVVVVGSRGERRGERTGGAGGTGGDKAGGMGLGRVRAACAIAPWRAKRRAAVLPSRPASRSNNQRIHSPCSSARRSASLVRATSAASAPGRSR